eukprot:246827_1
MGNVDSNAHLDNAKNRCDCFGNAQYIECLDIERSYWDQAVWRLTNFHKVAILSVFPNIPSSIINVIKELAEDNVLRTMQIQRISKEIACKDNKALCNKPYCNTFWDTNSVLIDTHKKNTRQFNANVNLCLMAPKYAQTVKEIFEQNVTFDKRFVWDISTIDGFFTWDLPLVDKIRGCGSDIFVLLYGGKFNINDIQDQFTRYCRCILKVKHTLKNCIVARYSKMDQNSTEIKEFCSKWKLDFMETTNDSLDELFCFALKYYSASQHFCDDSDKT